MVGTYTQFLGGLLDDKQIFVVAFLFFYLPGKHKLYCVKIEASCYPNGEVCNWTRWEPGATADITLFRWNLAWHKRATKKSPSALAVVDHGEASQEHPRCHAAMLDKGYIGIQDVIR